MKRRKLPKPAEVRTEKSEFWPKQVDTFAPADTQKVFDWLAARPLNWRETANARVIAAYREHANWIIASAQRILAVPYPERRRMTHLPPKDLALLKDEQVRQLEIDAKSVLLAADNMTQAIGLGDMHIAIDAAMRLQRAWEVLRVRRHERNAAKGRLHRERSTEGVRVTNAVRKQKPNPLAAQVQADYKRYLQTTNPREIVSLLAKKYKRSPSQIRRIKKRASQ